MNPFAATLNAQADAWDAAADALGKATVAPDRAEAIEDAEVGETPSEVVYEENKLRLLRYDAAAAGIEPEDEQDVPILIVYALINRPYILDLQPNRSVVRRLLEAGFDVYLIDWGEPSLLDAELTLDDYVNRYVENCVDVVREDAGVEAINLLGYCMGGTMSAIYAALHPEKVNTLGLMAAGLCFAGEGGVLELWGNDDYFDPSTLHETFGTVPAEFFDVGFQLMDPVENTISKYVRLYENVEDEDFVENFARMETWLADGIDMAGATYEQFLEDIYQENALYENELRVGGEHVDLGEIDMPVLQIVAEYDHLVPPEASTPFNDVVGSDDTAVMEVSAGHIGLSVGSRSHAELWPAVCEWFAERSVGDERDLQRIDGVGPAYEERLRGAGIETLADLGAADPDALAGEIDVSPERVRDWIDAAREMTDR